MVGGVSVTGFLLGMDGVVCCASGEGWIVGIVRGVVDAGADGMHV